MSQATEQNQSLRKRIGDTQPKIAQLESVKQPTEESKDELRGTQNDLRARLKDAEKRKGGFDERIGNFNSILEQRICPVCERPVEPEEFRTKCQHVIGERSILENEISTCEKSIAEIDLLMDGLGRYETALQSSDGVAVSELHSSKDPQGDFINHHASEVVQGQEAVGARLARLAEEVSDDGWRFLRCREARCSASTV